MQNSVNPGHRNPWSELALRGKSFFSALLLLLATCIAANANASPPGVPDFTNPNTRLIITQDYSAADNIAKNIVEAHVVDDAGNPVVGVTVYFTPNPGTVTVSVVTNASGIAELQLASTQVGPVQIDARIGATNFNPSVTVTFVAYQPDVTVDETRLEVTRSGAIANGTDLNEVKAVIYDANGNPVPNQSVTFSILSGVGTITSPMTVITDLNGEAYVSIASNTPGTVNIVATVNGTAIPNGSPAPVQFVLNVPDVTVSTTRLEVVTTGSLANGSDINTVRAVITDAGGNPVPNATVVFTMASGTATFTTPIAVTTDVNGYAIISMNSNTPGTVTITATVDGTPIPNGSPASVVFVVDSPDVNSPATVLEVLTTGALANGTATNSVRAHITDQFGNPVPGQTVTFVIANGTATPSALTVITDASGNAVLTLTSTVANTVDITADVNGTAIPNGSPASVVFVNDAPTVNVPSTRLVVIKTGATADDVDLNTVKAIITDANGNPVAGQSVTFSISSGTAVFVGSTTLITDASGEVSINLQSTTAGIVDIVATLNGTPIINGSPASVEFVAGPPDLSNPLTAIIIDANDADADGTATNIVRAHIVDAYGNPVASQTIVFSYTGTATAAGPLTLTTDPAGNAILTLTSTTIGTVDVTATVNGTPIINGSPATVRFTAFPDPTNPQTQLIVVTDNAFADNVATNSIRAHVVDNQGNPMAGAQVIFTIASGDATITTPQPLVTDANGDVIIFLTSATPGIVTVTATVDGIAIINGSPATVKFNKADVWVPGVFTPNGDGTNDMVRPIISGTFTLQYFNIYNRWGNLLFTTNNVAQGWDGRFKGTMQPNETYLWILVGTNGNNQRVQKRGMISLVR